MLLHVAAIIACIAGFRVPIQILSNQHLCALIGNVGPSVNMIGLSFKQQLATHLFIRF